MRSLIPVSLAVGVLCALLAGCGPKPAPTPQLFTITIPEAMCGNEVEFERRTPPITTRSEPGGVLEVSSDDNRLRIEKGKVTLNDKDFGTVEKGDRVKVTADGKLFVNGVERHP
jgi:hypothetical protein